MVILMVILVVILVHGDDDGIWRAWCRHQNDVIWWKQPCARICDVTTILADATGKPLLLQKYIKIKHLKHLKNQKIKIKNLKQKTIQKNILADAPGKLLLLLL